MHPLNSTNRTQPLFNSTHRDFERPLNTTLEDSIHMPQNHNNRPRRRQARESNRSQTTRPTTQDAVSQSTSKTVRFDLPAPVRMVDDSTGVICGVPGSSQDTLTHDEQEIVFPRGVFETSGFNAYPRRDATGRRPPPLLVPEKEMRDGIRKVDFRHVIDPVEPLSGKNAAETVVRKSGDVRPALARKDGNTKMEKGDGGVGKVMYSKIHEREGTLDESIAGAKGVLPMTAVVESISPMKVFSKRPIPTAQSSSSSTLDHVRRLRAEEHEKKIKELCKEMSAVKVADVGGQKEKALIVEGSGQTASTSSKAPEFLPDMNVSDENWAEPLHAMAAASTSKTNPTAAKQSQSTNDDVNQAIDSLAAAMSDISHFGNIVSSPPKHRSYERKSAVPAPLDLDNIKTSQTALKNAAIEETELSKSPPGAEIRMTQNKPVQEQEQAKESKESIATVSSAASSQFERIGTPENVGSEHNGARRKWYKGFRR